MITEKSAELLTEQIGSELAASHNYRGIALYFARQSLMGWAKLFMDQAAEEREHAEKIIAFLVDNEVPFDLPAIGAATTRFSSALEATQAALDSERKVSGQFRTLSSVSLEEDDYTTFQFLSGSSRSRSKRRPRCRRSSISSTAESTYSKRNR